MWWDVEVVPDALVMLLIRVLKRAVSWMELRSASVSVHRKGLEIQSLRTVALIFIPSFVVHDVDHGMLTSMGLFP